MKYLAILVLTVSMSIQALAQDVYMTRSGEITFFSSTPLEDIEAHNKTVTCLLKTQSGEMVFKLFMKSFAFERAAMQEHFNKDYVHSDEFPKATFTGTVSDIDKIDLSEEGEFEVEVEGDLTIHGVTQPVAERGQIIINNGKIYLSSVFEIELSDFNVKVPLNMIKSISKTVEITVEAVLEKYER